MASQYSPRETIPDVLLRLAARPEGVAISEVVGLNVVSVRTAVQRLRLSQQLHSATVGNVTRYFARAEHATQWLTTARTKSSVPMAKASHSIKGGQQIVRRTNTGLRAWWDPTDPSIQPVITDRTVHIIAPPPPVPRKTNTHSEWGG